MDAVSHKETTQQIRLYSVNHDAGQTSSAAQKAETASPAQWGGVASASVRACKKAVGGGGLGKFSLALFGRR